MSLGPAERLKRLEKLLAENEERKKKASEDEKEAEKALEETKRALSEELEELRRDEEVRELSERIASLEGRGVGDEDIVAELERRGVDASTLRSALRRHLEEHPEHDHEGAEESLEEIASEAGPARADAGLSYDPERARGAAIYALAEQAVDTSSMYKGPSLESRAGYDALKGFQHEIAERGGVMTPNEYDALRAIEEHVERRGSGYAQSERKLIQEIKQMTGLRVQSAYHQSWDDNDEY